MKLSNVSSPYGAPMGRRSASPGELSGKTSLNRVRINSGGYDSGGAYWGIGSPLYCAEDEEGGAVFLRASSRADACRRIIEKHGAAILLRVSK